MRNATQPSPPQQPAATFGQIEKSARRDDIAPPNDLEPDFTGIAQSAEFRELRRKQRGFTFPMTALFLVWYLGYVIVAAYFPEFMAIRLFGAVNIGLVFGVGQFASTLVIIAVYLRYAGRAIDPRARELYRNATGEERP